MPLPKQIARLTLGELGAPELWVEYRCVSGMPYKEVYDTFHNNESDQYVKTRGEFARLIADWNIPVEDDGEILPLPKDDPTSVDKVPMSYINYILSAIEEDQNQVRVGDKILNLVKERETNSIVSS